MPLATRVPLASKSLFTVEEANQALPLVRAIVADLVAEFRRLRLAGREQRDAAPAARGHPEGPEGNPEALEGDPEGLEGHPEALEGAAARAAAAERVREASERVEGCLRELSALGLEMRDFELGLVDFPALVGSEPAFLSWRLGEARVQTWHAADGGRCAQRLPLSAAPDAVR